MIVQVYKLQGVLWLNSWLMLDILTNPNNICDFVGLIKLLCL